MNIALLTAAGIGERMNQEIPKQFIHVENKPIIIYTLEAFQNHPSIDYILVVCLEGWHDILKAYAKQFDITKLKWVVSGGKVGQESINRGLQVLKTVCSDDDIILVHDSIRPLVSQDVISDCIAQTLIHGNATAVIPCMEVMLITNDNKISNESFNREKLKRTQTPQGILFSKILKSHEKAKELNIENSIATCTILIETGETVYFSRGSEKNIKITTTEDIEIFKALLKVKKDSYIKS